MHVCLLTAPTISDFGDPEITLDAHKPRGPQLGVLTVAAAARARGHRPTVIDLDRVAIDALRVGGESVTPDDLFDAFVAALAPVRAELFGFSTICGSYPLTIRLAREVAARHPGTPIVFGGPQASVVDVRTLETFDWIDLVVRGEADATFPGLLDALDGAAVEELDVDALPGLTVRRGGRVFRTPPAPLVDDLDALPLPAFELDPHIATRRSAHLELGRGCPYGCTFCSTNDFFRRRFRLKSSRVLLDQMRELRARYGVRAFTLVHDMYTVNRDRVVEFCELLLASGETFEWSCSARTDRVDRELLTLMARAGCAGIFFGVETGSVALQRDIKKRLDLDQAWQAVRAATDNRMKTAVALIAGFPTETREDLRSTVHFFVRSTRLDHAEPQMSLLAPLAETPIEKQYRGRLVFDHIYSDMSYQGWREDPKDFALIERYPEIFPNFYSVPALLPRAYVREVHDFVLGVTLWFRWLPIALLDTTGDLLAVFDAWTAWHDAARARADFTSPERTVRYYCTNVFEQHLRAFVGEALATGVLPDVALLRDAWAYESALAELIPVAPGDLVGSEPRVRRAGAHERPTLASNVTVRSFPFDAAALIAVLRRGGGMPNGDRAAPEPPAAQGTVTAPDTGAAHGGQAASGCVTTFAVFPDRPVEVRQLSSAAADLLALCDGSTTVTGIVDRYRARTAVGIGPSRTGSTRDPGRAALAGLTALYQDGLLDLAHA